MTVFQHNTVKFDACLWFSESLYILVTVCHDFGLNSEVSNKKIIAFYNEVHFCMNGNYSWIYEYIHVYIYIYIYMHAYICIYYIYYIYSYMYEFMYVCTCMCIHVYMYMDIYDIYIYIYNTLNWHI